MGGCVFANAGLGFFWWAAVPLFVVGGLGLLVVVEGMVLWAMDRRLSWTDAALAAAWSNTVSTLAGVALASLVLHVPVSVALVAGYALSVVIEVLTLWPFWHAPRGRRLVVPVAMANLASYALLAAVVYSLHMHL